MADAEAIAQWLLGALPPGLGVDLFSSDLQRARRTAKHISDALGTAVTLDARLREKSYGTADGRAQRWLDERFIPPPAAGDRLNHDEGILGAETKAAFAAWIKMPLEALGYASFRPCPGSITTLCQDDYFHNRQVAALAEAGHLDRPH